MSYDAEVVIVGAGPTGALLGCLLGAGGINTIILERNHDSGPQSRAIGITPPSLEILDGIGLAQGFVRSGVPVRRAVVHDARRSLGTVAFEAVHRDYGFVLALPQTQTVALLHERVALLQTVRLLRGCEVVQVAQNENGVSLVCSNGEPVRARFVAAADGAHSTVAQRVGNRRRYKLYRPRFFMADHRDRSSLGDAAHVWFTPQGAVESFPLPAGTRRWIVQLFDEAVDGDADLEAMVWDRARVFLRREDRIWQSGFQPERSEVERFAMGRLFFAGDAAHTMSPIGGQGMNTGFADAELLARTLIELLSMGTDRVESSGGVSGAALTPGAAGRARADFRGVRGALAGRYEYARRIAFRSAARRAAAGMWVGTIRGEFGSLMRSLAIEVSLRFAMPAVARHFSMQTIPFRRARGVLD